MRRASVRRLFHSAWRRGDAINNTRTPRVTRDETKRKRGPLDDDDVLERWVARLASVKQAPPTIRLVAPRAKRSMRLSDKAHRERRPLRKSTAHSALTPLPCGTRRACSKEAAEQCVRPLRTPPPSSSCSSIARTRVVSLRCTSELGIGACGTVGRLRWLGMSRARRVSGIVRWTCWFLPQQSIDACATQSSSRTTTLRTALCFARCVSKAWHAACTRALGMKRVSENIDEVLEMGGERLVDALVWFTYPKEDGGHGC